MAASFYAKKLPVLRCWAWYLTPLFLVITRSHTTGPTLAGVQRCLIYNDKSEKLQTLTVEKLEAENVWHYCLTYQLVD